jgi:hypothetical protein
MPSRRAAAIGIGVIVLLVLAAELVAAGTSRTDQVLSVGVQPVYPVGALTPGATACQQPLGVTESFDRVHFNIGTFGKPGPPLYVSVVDQQSKAELGSGRVAPGWVDNGTAQDVNVGRIPPGHLVGVCIRNEGPVRAYVYGDFYNGRFGTGPLGVTPTNTTTSAVVDKVPLDADLSIRLLSSSPRSLLARFPAILRHLGTFKPPWVDAWTFWLLAILIVAAAPLALWRAAAWAAREDGS